MDHTDEQYPQSFNTSNASNMRNLTESCGHVNCRLCSIVSASGINQSQMNRETWSFYPKEKGTNQSPYVSHTDKSESSSSGPSKKASQFVKVELTESSTLFTMSIPGEMNIRNERHNPILIHNTNTFIFSRGQEETCAPVLGQSNFPFKNNYVKGSGGSLGLFQSQIPPSCQGLTVPVGNPSNLPLDTRFHLNGPQCKDPRWMGVPNRDMAPPFPMEMDTNNKDRGSKQMKSSSPVPSFISIMQRDLPLYECNICKREFRTKFSIKDHSSCVTGRKPYKCEYEHCGKEFIQKSSYEYHLRTHKCEKPFECFCGNAFYYRSRLAYHMRSHIGQTDCEMPNRIENLSQDQDNPIDGKRICCNYCNRTFFKIRNLKRHLMVHSNQIPFKCPMCKTAVKFRDGLVKHIIRIHGQPKVFAEMLANDAGLKYLRETMKNDSSFGNIDVSKIPSIVLSTALKKSNLIFPEVTEADVDYQETESTSRSVLPSFPCSSSSFSSGDKRDKEIEVITLD